MTRKTKQFYKVLFLKCEILIDIWLPEKSCRLALNVELGSWDVPSILTLFHISFGIWIFHYILTSILTLFHFNLGVGSISVFPSFASYFYLWIIDFILTSFRISFKIWICQNLSCKL